MFEQSFEKSKKSKPARSILALVTCVCIMIAMMPVQADAAYGWPARVKKSSMKVYSVTSTSMYVKWKKAKKAKKYRVAYKQNKKGAKWKYKTVKSTKAKLTDLSPEKKYVIKVRGINGWLYGKWSATVSKKTDSRVQDMLDQVNYQRKKKGLKKLKLYKEVNKTALVKAKDLKKTGVFDHKSTNLGYFYNQYDKANLIYWSGGENIAMGFYDVTSVMRAWMNSKGHRANILDPDYTHLGVGRYKTYWVQHFIENPKTSGNITCRNCGKTFIEKKGKYEAKGNGYAYDKSGKIVYIGSCPYCDEHFIKCPKCKNGVLDATYKEVFGGGLEGPFDCMNCSYKFIHK